MAYYALWYHNHRLVFGFFRLTIINSKCYNIGLTGGIASGKSAVSDYFVKLGCEVIDADVIARDVVKTGSLGLQQLVGAFGVGILDESQHLNRSKLRQMVFNNDAKLKQLNSILHPLIFQQIQQEIKKIKSTYCIVVIPLLCESTRYQWLNRVLVVDVLEKTQQQRLMQRDNINEELAIKMINSQCSRKQRLEIADDVINNSHSQENLQKQVETLNSLYKSF